MLVATTEALAKAYLFIEVGTIIIAVKLVAAICSKIKLAPVFGMVVLGIIIGPGVLNLIGRNPILDFLGSIGVLTLLFLAGLETDIKLMKETGKVSLLAALGGVFLPLFGGFWLCYFSNLSLESCYFTGSILTATSVSVTVMTLWEIEKLKTKTGTSILSAAIIDDVIGLIVLVIVMAFLGKEGNLIGSMLKVVGFIVIGSLVGIYILPHIYNYVLQIGKQVPKISLSFAFSTMFLYAGFAEICEIAPITGAYMAGLFIGIIDKQHIVAQETETMAQSFFTPIFFASIGLMAKFDGMLEHIIFILLFLFIACICKVIGSGLASKAAGFTWVDSLRVGIGMMPRGEVALAIASIGLAGNYISSLEFNATIILVICSAAITPIFLRLSYNIKEEEEIKQ